MEEQLKNIYSKTPGKLFLRTNLTILLSTLILIILSFLISYNDIVYAETELNPIEPFTIARSQTQGFIDQIYVRHGDTIKAGKILASIENNASTDDVLYLKQALDSININQKDNFKHITQQKLLALRYGEVQPFFYEFLRSVQDYETYNTRQPLASNILSLEQQVKNQEALLRNQSQKLNNFRNIISISSKNLKKNEELYSKGVISENDLTLVQQEYFSKLNEFSELSSNVERTRLNLTELKSNKFNLYNDSISKDQLFIESLSNNFNSLNNAIESWEKKYLLRSSINGVVSFNDKLERNQFIDIGKNVFTVFPINISGMQGTAKISTTNSGKIKTGQIAYIRLDNLPSSQFGKFQAHVTGISKTPDTEDNTYTVFLQMDNLTSDYDYKLDLKGTVIGTSEIVTEKLSLAERLLYGLRELLQRKQ